MFEFLHRRMKRWLLQEPEYAFLWEPDTTGEVVAIDCETTGLNIAVDELMSICAIRIRGNQILTSQRLELLIKPWRLIYRIDPKTVWVLALLDGRRQLDDLLLERFLRS